MALRGRDETAPRLVLKSPFLSLVPEDSDPELVTRVSARDPDWKSAFTQSLPLDHDIK